MTKDFTAWARPDLVLTIDGREYRSRPPTVGEAPLFLAIAVRIELYVGLVDGEMPANLAELIEQQANDQTVAQVTLRPETVDELVADHVPLETINRMGLYAALYWARGEAAADLVAELAWGQDVAPGEADEAPKDRKGSTNGPSTASENPTRTASTRTTGSRSTSSRRRRKRQ